MQSWNKFPRIILFITLLTGLLVGLSAPVFVDETVNAAPMRQIATNVVISEFRSTGPNGGTDEFVEIYNPTNASIDISGWKIQKSAGCGAVNATPLLNFPPSTSIVSGQYLLITGVNYSGLTAFDFSATLSIADDGGIAIINSGTTVIDQVGMCATTAYREGTTLAPLSGTANQSYERGNIGCTDTDNNAADFIWNQTISNPQNSSSIPIPCLRVTNVTSTALDTTYTAGASIPVTITFSTNVNVTGSPTLLLETGATDRNATYSSGSGSNILTFNYIVMAGDVSGDLDYVATNSLALNGGTITGAVGNANLTLPSQSTTCPSPTTPCSLGANKAIVIDNLIAPGTISFTRQSPFSSSTNADTLIFRATFSEPVAGADINDFVVHPNTFPASTTTATVTNVTTISSSIYDVTISGGDLLSSTFNGIVGLDLSGAQNITDTAPALNPLPNIEPTIDDLYTVDNIKPTVTVEQAIGQADPANATPVNFTVVFSEAINVSTFTVGDITQSGTISGSLITWGITPTIDPLIFTLSATAVAGIGTTGTLIPTIPLDKVFDVAGNGNSISIVGVPDNIVNFQDTIAPTVTVNQAVGQTDPTALFPINFTVVFSEPIIASIFIPADITQNGTATGITWSITDSGDHTTFTLSATAVTGTGTIIPSIIANRVTDLVGNNNTPSTSTDNTIVYETTRPTVTVNQAVGQADPTALFPINFTVVFSEPINVSTFTPADITQNGTATGITWAITPTINPLIFTLSATALTGKGTLIPTIAVNKVTDMAGNNNFASTSTDNTVTSTANLATPTRTLTPTATATPTLGVVIISEVAWMGTLASSTDEWVELYNSGSTVVDLSNWTLNSTDGVISITFLATDSDHMINPGEYFILAPSGVFTDVTINKNISATFDNNGKSLQLRNNLGILMDTANSDGGTWPAGIASPTFATMERHAGTTLDSAVNWYTFAGTPVKHDRTNNLVKGTPGYANWATFVTATPSRTPTATSRPPTPFRTPTPIPPPLVGRPVINEFLPRPGFDWNQDGKVDVFDEFIEIKNLGAVDISMSGWKLDDDENKGSAPFGLPDVILKPGERLVFYGLQTNILLSDGGDTVRLLNPSSQVYDAYTYKIAKTEDASICRLPDTDLFGAWYEDCVPTPNLINTRDGVVPSMPENGFESPVCDLPDTLPADFLFAECRGYGAKIWNAYYWDKVGWRGDQFVPENRSKWESFVE